MAGPEESGIRMSETHTYGSGRGWHRMILVIDGTLSRRVVDVWLESFGPAKNLLQFSCQIKWFPSILSFATDEMQFSAF